ncbi:glucose transporter type 1 [Trichonephila clavipes]|nr:glucose transporter type 1 [Trichonephila clavipes]
MENESSLPPCGRKCKSGEDVELVARLSTPELELLPVPTRMSCCPEGLTCMLVFAIFAAVLGMFQFGYNTGVINAPQKIIQKFISDVYKSRTGLEISDDIRDLLWSLIVSVFAIGGMIGGLIGGSIANKFGRKGGLLVNNALGIIGAALMGSSKISQSIEILVVGRLIIGMNCGINTALVPMYLSEISPLTLRGGLGTVNQLGITIGLLLSQVLGIEAILGTAGGWPFLLGISVIPAVLQLLILPLCPESPRYLLISKQQESLAREALQKLRCSSLVEEDIEEMKAEDRAQQHEPETAFTEEFRIQPPPVQITIWKLLKNRSLHLPLVIGVVMQLTQQLSGINATGSAGRRPGQGRRRATTPNEDRYLVLTARRHRNMNATLLQQHLRSATGTTVSTQTVRNRLHGVGLYARRSMVCVRLSSRHRRDRRDWATEHVNWRRNEWSNLLFSDESRFSVHPDNRRIFIWRDLADALGRRVAGRQPPPQTLQELERVLLKEWDRIPQLVINSLIDSMPQRIADPRLKYQSTFLHVINELSVVFDVSFSRQLLLQAGVFLSHLNTANYNSELVLSASPKNALKHNLRLPPRPLLEKDFPRCIGCMCTSMALLLVLYYSTGLFMGAGLPENAAKYATIGVGVVMVIMTLISIPLMDRKGRRTLQLYGLGGMFIFSIFITITMLVKFLYYWLAYLSVVSTLFFVVFYAMGPGPIPWMITAELFSQQPRPAAMSITVTVNWFANFVVGLVFPIMQRFFENYTFLVFTMFLAGFWTFTYKKIPETKNKTFEEISALFRRDEDTININGMDVLRNSLQPADLLFEENKPADQCEFQHRHHCRLRNMPGGPVEGTPNHSLGSSRDVQGTISVSGWEAVMKDFKTLLQPSHLLSTPSISSTLYST